jgi:hypothetical protein
VQTSPNGTDWVLIGDRGLFPMGTLGRGSLQVDDLEDFTRYGFTVNKLTGVVASVYDVMMPGAQTVEPRWCHAKNPGEPPSD